MIKASSKTELRLACPNRTSPPTRQAVIRSSDLFAHRAHRRRLPQAHGERHRTSTATGRRLPKAPILSSIWLIDAADCEVQALSARVGSTGFARLEHAAADEKELMNWLDESSFLSPNQLDWLHNASDIAEWRSRYLSIRPAGPHPTGRISQPGLTDFEGDIWISASDQYTLTLPPHQRHDIRAVFLGPRTAACIYLDQNAHCRSNEPAEQWLINDNEPTLDIKRWQGLSQSKTHRWTVMTGETSQELSIDGPALLKISSIFPTKLSVEGERSGCRVPALGD